MAMTTQLVTLSGNSLRTDWTAGICSPLLYTIVRLYRNGSLYDEFNTSGFSRSYTNLPAGTYYTTVTGYTTGPVQCDTGTSNSIVLTAYCIPADATFIKFSQLARFYSLEVDAVRLSGDNNPSTGDNIFGKSDLPTTGVISKTIPNAVSELRGRCGGNMTWVDAGVELGSADAVAVGEDGTIIALSPVTTTWSLRPGPVAPTYNRVWPFAVAPWDTKPFFLTGGELGVSAKSTDGHFWLTGRNQELLLHNIKAIGYSKNTSASTNKMCVVAGSNFYYSSNNGLSWTARLGQASGMNAMSPLSPNVIWLGGDGGVIKYSTDPFSSWTTISWGVSTTIRDMAQVLTFSAAVGWVAVGDNGTIRTTTNGSSWVARTSNTTNTLNSIGYSPSVSGTRTTVVVGNGGVIRTSTNGTTWTSRTSGTAVDLNGVAWINGYGFIAVGNNGVIRRSTDLGVTWTSMTSPTSKNLKSISAGLSTAPLIL